MSRRCDREGVACARHGGARADCMPSVAGGRYMPRGVWFTEFYFDVLGYWRSWQSSPRGSRWRVTEEALGDIRATHAAVRAHLAEPSPLPGGAP